jgi:hypothetical protein
MLKGTKGAAAVSSKSYIAPLPGSYAIAVEIEKLYCRVGAYSYIQFERSDGLKRLYCSASWLWYAGTVLKSAHWEC